MNIADIKVLPGWGLQITADDDRVDRFDVSPYLAGDAFKQCLIGHAAMPHPFLVS